MVLPGSGVESVFLLNEPKPSTAFGKAVAAHPFMVAGTGRYDTTVMNNFETRAFIKMGSEGVMIAALPEQGLGFAIKTDDDANRAAEVAMSAVLHHFGGESLCRMPEDHAVFCSHQDADTAELVGRHSR